MRILILNGNPDNSNNYLVDYLQELSDLLISKNHFVLTMNLSELDIKYCAGCWGCWVKTPGECVAKDDSHKICHAFINSNFVIFASPIIMGFTSAILKKAHDKLLPLLHPYFCLLNHEICHLPRYNIYPSIGLLLQKNSDSDADDVNIITDIYRRIAINLNSSLCSTWLTDSLVQEIAGEIDRL